MARRSTHSAVQPPDKSDSSDVNGDRSQHISVLNSLLQTPKTNYKELHEFDAKRAADQQELKQLLEKRAQQAEITSIRRRNELTKAILDALQTPNRNVHGAPPTLGNTKIARNAVFKTVARILRASEYLVSEYDKLDKVITGMHDSEHEGIAEAWVGDVAKTERLLRFGAETAVRNVKRVLGADVDADDVEHEDETMEVVGKLELSYELKRSLQFAERGVKKMVKSLPRDEGR
ncbi:hypothetical protein C7974DRAFT_452622 [Boeremia exigua]|uniref:uncharacterized protein n=1 Tax=Boeremia exigua TaxID=749465 RepID=UPI001E8D5818|nr:uncharacterized protein C7974DRAFT_452622 [Boeremia exigua]KAH6633366.1 hypothetical protein C7974DRAFT_452622 [Boeremia exigua]